jgi:hypothetical protein
MALAHFHTGTVSRASGRSAVDAAAYVLRVNMLDQRTGQSYSYGRNAADAVNTFVWLPKGASDEYRDAAVLANYMESRETRKNSRTARTFEGALPHELSEEQRERLVKDFAREFTRKGFAVIVGIHRPHEHGDERNHHFHMLISTRTMDAKGFGDKARDLDKVETLEAWRSRFETLTNKQLERHGHEARIDMRSYEKQGSDQVAQIHMGPVAAALERNGIATDRGDQVRGVMLENLIQGRIEPKTIAAVNEAEKQEADQQQRDEQRQGRSWTEGKARTAALSAEEVIAVSAVDRQRQEDQAARVDAQRQADRDDYRASSVPLHLRMMAAAFRFLRIHSSVLADRVLGRMDEGTISASMRAERRQMIERAASPREHEKAVQDPERFISLQIPQTDPAIAIAADAPKLLKDRQKTWMAQSGGYEQLPAQLKHSAEASFAKWKAASSRAAAGIQIDDYVRYVQGKEQERAGLAEPGSTPNLPRPRAEKDFHTFVNRGQRPAPYRAMLGELRDNQRDADQGSSGGYVWSFERPAETSPAVPATPAHPGFVQRLEQQQKAKGERLADLLPKEQRKRQQEREDGLGLDLEL